MGFPQVKYGEHAPWLGGCFAGVPRTRVFYRLRATIVNPAAAVAMMPQVFAGENFRKRKRSKKLRALPSGDEPGAHTCYQRRTLATAKLQCS